MTLTFNDHNYGTIEESTTQTMYVVIFICSFSLVTYIVKFIIFHQSINFDRVTMAIALYVKSTTSLMANKHINSESSGFALFEIHDEKEPEGGHFRYLPNWPRPSFLKYLHSILT